MAEAALKEDKKESPVLVPGRMKESEFARTLWVVTVEAGVTRNDLTTKEFWAHAAQRLKPYDRIEVRHDEGEFFAEYLVISVGRGYAVVKELDYIELQDTTIEEVQNNDYEVKFKGPVLKWTVIRKADGERVKEGMEKGEAYSWLAQYLKTIT